MDVGFRLQETKTLGNLNSTNDRNYGTVSMDWAWAIKPVLFLVAGFDWLDPGIPERHRESRTDGRDVHKPRGSLSRPVEAQPAVHALARTPPVGGVSTLLAVRRHDDRIAAADRVVREPQLLNRRGS